MPYSAMTKINKSFILDYLITKSKGNKSRLIKIHSDDLKLLDDEYIQTFYSHRTAKYKAKYGKECPPSILFLNQNGDPITPKMIAARSLSAKIRTQKKYPNFRNSICFYDSRHWWPTQFMIKTLGKDIIAGNSRVFNAAIGQILINQMGHSDIKTTFRYYLDMARLLLTLNANSTTEIITNSNDSTLRLLNFIKKQRFN
jgi:integrase